MSRTQRFGRYELLDRISAGGMAEVFRARDTARGHIVALKRILPQVAEDEEFIRMFEDEARIASQLEHPHIARMLDFGRVEESYYIAFEYVDGRDLRALFDWAVRAGQHPPLSFLVHVFTRIGEGLAYAHARKDASGAPVSIVHRDVSPQNIVVSFDGDVKLIDFGIAKAAGKLSRTQVGMLKGKFGYMAPEQVRGDDVDQRADVFSLGICMWELLTLERLFNADNELLVLEKVRSALTPPPSTSNLEVPAELDRIVLKALAKGLNERYRAAKDLYRDLNQFSQGSGIIASRSEVAHYMRRAFPDHPGRHLPTDGVPGNVSIKERNLETRAMAADNKGSDLDIFEGLGKKNASRPSTAPPPPPRSSAAMPAPPARNDVAVTAKKTLLGISSPAAAGGATMPGSRVPTPPPRSAPPPPPGRGSLPQVVPPPPKAGTSVPPPAMSARSAPPPAQPSATPPPPAVATKPGNPNLDMDWDDEDEATHIFDKAATDEATARLSEKPRPAAGTPLAPPASSIRPHQTLMGLNSPMSSAPPPASTQPHFRASAPPPPPSAMPSGGGGAGGAFARSSSMTSSAPGPVTFPHAAPTIDPSTIPQAVPGGLQGQMPPQVSTVPMPMPGPRAEAAPAYAPPIISGNRMEATQLVRPQSGSGRMGLVGLGVVFAALAAGLVLFLMMPRTGRIAINVADAKGGSVQHVEIFVDGKKHCDTAPCLVDQLSAGAHNVKVLAVGYEAPADRAVTVEARKDAQIDFSLTGTAAKSGTGIKVSGAQSGVKLFVDGKEIGPLPQELRDLAPGDHKIRVAGTDRYAAIEKNVIVAKDEMQDLGDLKLKVVKGKATITLGTLGAKVSIVSGTDRREFPTLPIAVDLDTSKSWALEASKPGFIDYHQPVSFEDGQAEKTFNIVLDPKGAAPVAMAMGGGGGGGGGGGAPSLLAAAPRPVAAPAPKPAAAAAEDTAAPAAAGGESFLNINSIPASSVVLDGKPIGNTPKVHIAVTPGAHTVLFVNAEQGLKKQISVSVGAGETKPAIAKLRE